jgi:hypothetical protein
MREAYHCCFIMFVAGGCKGDLVAGKCIGAFMFLSSFICTSILYAYNKGKAERT